MSRLYVSEKFLPCPRTSSDSLLTVVPTSLTPYFPCFIKYHCWRLLLASTMGSVWNHIKEHVGKWQWLYSGIMIQLCFGAFTVVGLMIASASQQAAVLANQLSVLDKCPYDEEKKRLKWCESVDTDDLRNAVEVQIHDEYFATPDSVYDEALTGITLYVFLGVVVFFFIWVPCLALRFWRRDRKKAAATQKAAEEGKVAPEKGKVAAEKGKVAAEEDKVATEERKGTMAPQTISKVN
ncbi:hypothetical protein B0T25DRAFT_576926 [Lasiosphaeria hispida]|uniref:Transmembrane protein n=1 Tax=Lasiosphaeria hispida TaxID=260671 RepID=A0AAJ0MLC9_9PEZI|nr:hypothetical protein B0T25DRAFT_576926 [Lasiosphaeria hispida]